MTENEKANYIAKIGETGFRGVRACRDKTKPCFMGQIVTNNNGVKTWHKTERFDTSLEAAIAYDKLAKVIHKEKAVTNKMLGLIDMGKIDKEPNKDQVLNMLWENIELDDRLKRISRGFCEYLSIQRNSKGKFIEFERKAKFNIPQDEAVKIITELSSVGMLNVEESTRNYPPKLWHVRIKINAFLAKKVKKLREKHAQEQEMSIKKDTSITLEKANSLEHKSPEELAAMAQELLKLSEAKKQEIANGDVLKKQIRPLILACFQSKGKVERSLNELLDVTTELDNALNALRDAIK